MKKQTVKEQIEAIMAVAEKLTPAYVADPKDAFSEGNVAICIIDGEGNVYGRL